MALLKQRPATLYFLERLELYEREKPYLLSFPVKNIEGAKLTNLALSPVDVLITDLRTCSDQFDVDTVGFKWLISPLRFDSFLLESSVHVRGLYCQDMELLMKRLLGAEAVFTFQTVIRKAPSAIESPALLGLKVDHPGPIQGAHVDLSETTAHRRKNAVLMKQQELGLLSEQDATRLSARRFKILNSWRPLSTVRGWPLALCDFRTLNETKDLVRMDNVHRSHVEEAMQVHHSEGQKWYYIDLQTTADVLVFQMYDSLGGPVACHASFPLGAEDEQESEIRESIETRFVAIY